jgi:hypothetical protein
LGLRRGLLICGYVLGTLQSPRVGLPTSKFSPRRDKALWNEAGSRKRATRGTSLLRRGGISVMKVKRAGELKRRI